MAIHCHSARYHYDSFHSRGGDVINIGSNNTYNIFGGGYNMGFGGYTMFGSQLFGRQSFFGSFGASLGWGIGNGLMNWLGNGLSGGGWNPAGIFAGSSFGWGNGMGNFGMGMSTPWSSFGWGGSTGRGGSASSANTTEVIKDDPDCKKIADITSKIKDLKTDATEADIRAIINDIDKAIKDLDDNNKEAQKKTLENLKTSLEGRINKPSTPAAAASTTTPVAQDSDGSDNTDGAGGAGSGNTSAHNEAPAGASGTQPWSSVQGWGSNSLSDTTVTLPNGYSKISDNDNISEVNVAQEIKGKMRPVSGQKSTVSSEKYENTNYPLHISIHDSVKNKDFVYKCVGKTKDGNPVYATPASDKNNNVYILAKKGNSFELIQLAGFTGHKKDDKQNG